MAFAALCPAITIECGKAGNPEGIAHAAELADACLHLSAFPTHAIAPHDLDLFHTVGIVKVPDTTSFNFGAETADINFDPALDHMNFRELDAGTRIGTTSRRMLPLQVMDEDGHEVTQRHFEIRDGALVTRRKLMPSMLTLDERVIRQDCLCYLMERLPLPD